MSTTPNPTAESVIAEAMVNAGAPLMHSRVEESVAAALRANNLLSEGAPCEEQIERAERAAALAAIDRVRAILSVKWRDGGVPSRWHSQLTAALDGAPEPEEKP